MMVRLPLAVMVRVVTLPPTAAPGLTVCADVKVRPLNVPVAILPVTVEVMVPAAIFVAVLAIRVDAPAGFHAIDAVSFNGVFDVASDATVIGVVLSEPLKTALVTPPPLQPVIGRFTVMVWIVGVLVRPGLSEILPDAPLHVVPATAAPPGAAAERPIGTSNAIAVINPSIFFMQNPLS